MPIIAVVVGAIGSAVGTAVGAAIGGSILGVSAATIGGVIGAGIAGGVLAAATGGSFGKGFLMGAVGGAVGSFLKGGLGDTLGGATQVADGTTTAQMLAAQGGAEFAPDALSGMGEVAGSAAEVGFGELGGAAGDAFGGGAETFGLGETAPPIGTPIDAAEQGFSLDTLGTGVGTEAAGTNQFSLSNMPTDTNNIAATPTLGGTDQFAMTPGMQADTPLLSSDYSYVPEGSAASTTGSLENIGQVDMQVGADTSQGTSPVTQPQAAPAQGLGGTIKNMANTSDAWLKNTFGQSAPSTGKLLMSGGQYLMDKYQTDKLERQAKGLAPMSFEQYKTQFTNPQDYRNASAKLAQSGRTGTLPALLARMNERARQGYAGYLPGAKEKYLGTSADIASAKSRSLGNLFRNVMA